MAATVYECMFLYDPNAYAKNPVGAGEAINKLIEGSGGEILVSRLFNEQKLAYPIEGHRKGVYWLTYFKIDSVELSKFERQCRLNDRILRHLTLKVEPRLVDALVAAALGQAIESEPAESAGEGSTESADDNAKEAVSS